MTLIFNGEYQYLDRRTIQNRKERKYYSILVGNHLEFAPYCPLLEKNEYSIFFHIRKRFAAILLFVFECTIQKIYKKQRSKQSKAVSHTDKRYSHKQNKNQERIKKAD